MTSAFHPPVSVFVSNFVSTSSFGHKRVFSVCALYFIMARRLSLPVNDAWPVTWSDVYKDAVATDESIEVVAFPNPSTSACTTPEVSSANGLLFLQ